MNTRSFRELLEARWAEGKFVCVGLDSELSQIPGSVSHAHGAEHTMYWFNRAIVDATRDLVCAFKLQSAFYEAEGPAGIRAMIRTTAYIHRHYPRVPVIKDGKRADIGNTNSAYARATFDVERFDAVTLHPYLGIGALEPFLKRWDKGGIILCRTSNQEAPEFQDLEVERGGVRMPLWKYVAYQVAEIWNVGGNCALVVGATYPQELQEVRSIVGDMPILIPGVGFQQKKVSLEEQVMQVVSAGKDSRRQGMIINSSRGIIFASGGEDFAAAARRETLRLHDLINQYR